MSLPKEGKPRSGWLGRYAWGLAAIWTLLAAGSLAWSLHQERREIHDMARTHARTAFEKDLAYRRWAAAHGGVYVRVTEKTQPNVYLEEVPDRDIETPRGTLTLVNPAFMVRQVYELEARDRGLRSHITSLQPIRPENAPDAWEAEALRACQEGETEVMSIASIEGEPYMRLMRPLVTEKSCVTCHGEQGYTVGDIRGGISVSVPLKPLRATLRGHTVAIWLGHGTLWLFGLAGIAVGTRSLNRHIQKRHCAEKALTETENERRIVVEHNARLRAEQSLLLAEQRLRIAARIQKKSLPNETPAVDGLDIEAIWCPADNVSGDFYDYLPVDGERLGVVVADVSGHGISSALMVAEACAYLRTLSESCDDVSKLLTRLNELLAKNAADDRFVTLFLACFDLRDQSLVYAGAGHQGYLLEADGTVTILEATGLPLGVVPDTVIPAASPVKLKPGQTLLLLTDGIPEALSPEGELFGMERILELARVNRDSSARGITETMFRAVRDFSNGRPQEDDMTAVVLKVGCETPASRSPYDQRRGRSQLAPR